MNKILTTAAISALLVMPLANQAFAETIDRQGGASSQSSPVLVAEKAAKAMQMGSFVEVAPNHPTEGMAKLVEREGEMFLELSSDFKTVSGPAVYVVLHKSSDVGVNIEGTEYINLGKLTSIEGAQSYKIELPAGADINDYKSAVIWCQQFDVTFAAAAFQAS
ncbi:Electron transfer DM13 [Thalassoporum mexicanum PCC 7367]|uniref:DM13 domain-containing protein n=1 Tax=Thalassoporum mexicanum TaxID=3457544 RepID=UPI00029F95E7|nr:DM13 domain-containing protein [Pseudanabaena sp. PCC 7367]AFY71709.1 Electron transfer DM13 [Pseudanabaena sp. PCC 7367]